MRYYQVSAPDGTHYCQCTWESDAIKLCQMETRQGYYYRKVDIKLNLPVDVSSTDLGYEDRIRGQQGLPQSDWIEL